LSKPQTKFICFQSLPTCGAVGLKAYAEKLHNHWIPIPSIVLNSPGNAPDCQRYPLDSVDLLHKSVQSSLLKTKDFDFILVIGYLANIRQMEQLIDFLSVHRLRFAKVLIDPICGDNGKAYVDYEIISTYPRLLKFAEYHTPNATELKLISGSPSLNEALDWWKAQFPESDLMVTGVKHQKKLRIIHQTASTRNQHVHPKVPGEFSGTGDRFVAQFVISHFVEGKTVLASIEDSAGYVKKTIDF